MLMSRAERLAPAVAFLIALLVYTNTLHATFAFDDNFAVVYNGDVTNDSNPVLGLFIHDFWGQNIRSDMSHKSYRPLTVLSFRLIRQAWQCVPRRWRVHLAEWRKAKEAHFRRDDGTQADPDLDPLFFHAGNALMHAVVSALMARLAYRLFWHRLWLLAAAPPPLIKKKLSEMEHLIMLHRNKRRLAATITPCTCPTNKPCSAAKAPQVVGAPLMVAAAGAAAPQPPSTVAAAASPAAVALQEPGTAQTTSSASGLKQRMSSSQKPGKVSEQQQQQQEGGWLQQPTSDIGRNGTALEAEPEQGWDIPLSSSPGRAWTPWQRTVYLHFPAWLATLAFALHPAHTEVRNMGYMAGVENPIPFCESRLSRLLTTGYLHARYFAILLWPLHLSADWSFACVPLVTDLSDQRNVLTMLLYLYLFASMLLARPWHLLLSWWRGQGDAGTTAGIQAARWRLAVLAGLCVGPFFPASNVLFYVGTFIGERLLYFPSVGYCLLLAEATASMLGWASGASQTPIATESSYLGPDHPGDKTGIIKQDEAVKKQQQQQQQWRPMGSLSCMPTTHEQPKSSLQDSAATEAQRRRRAADPVWPRGQRWAASACLLYALVSGLLVFYAGRTYVRNWDWASEETLFMAAQQVCDGSAKVQLNSGVLERRRLNMPKSLGHFRRAREIEPSYCEPDYWIGITLINMGNTSGGLTELEAALSCKYVAVEAATTLHKIFNTMHHTSKTPDGTALMRWGTILLKPGLARLGEGCNTLEQAALVFAVSQRNEEAVTHCLTTCIEALHRALEDAHRPGGSHATVQGGSVSVSDLKEVLECVVARQPLYHAIALYGHASGIALQAAYRYLLAVQKAPYCRMPGGSSSEQAQLQANTPHMHLIHSIHTTHPEDPWLQHEWAETLTMSNPVRHADAATHFNVAAMLFVRHERSLSAPMENSMSPPPASPVKALSGKALSGPQALAAAVASLDHAARLYAQHVPPQVQKGCEAQLQALEAELRVTATSGDGGARAAAADRGVDQRAKRFTEGPCRAFQYALEALLKRHQGMQAPRRDGEGRVMAEGAV